jgi:hypothetical protein
MKQPMSNPLLLPRSIGVEIELLARRDGIGVNQFIAAAVAERLAAIDTATFFAYRRARVDFAAFDRVMRRKGGEVLGADDIIT